VPLGAAVDLKDAAYVLVAHKSIREPAECFHMLISGLAIFPTCCALREERRPKPPRYLLYDLHGVESGDVLGNVTVGIIPRRRPAARR
jgi:hypothetical protein